MEKPFYLERRNGWYIHTTSASGKRSYFRLAATEEKAYEEWHRRGGGLSEGDSSLLEKLANSYLAWAQRQVEMASLEKDTLDGYGWYLIRIVERWPGVTADDLKPSHVSTVIQETSGVQLVSGMASARSSGF